MSDKSIAVEPLISTDVDKLITSISDAERITLKDLQKTCNIDKKILEKWVKVLEDEGYVSLDYKLGATYVNWMGGTVEKDEVIGETEAVIAEMETESPLESDSAPAQKPVLSDVVAVSPGHLEETQEILEAQIERASEDASLEAKEAVATQVPAAPVIASEPESVKSSEDLRSSILTKLQETESHSEEKILLAAPRPVPEVAQVDVPESQSDEDISSPIKGRTNLSAQTRDLVESYIQQMNREKETISDLRRQKEKLYREKFSSIEGRAEADIGAITEVIIEKQSKIAELRQHYLELPDKVDELEKTQAQINALKTESLGNLRTITRNANSVLAELNGARRETHSKIQDLENRIKAGMDSLAQLEKTGASVETTIDALKLRSEEARSQVDELLRTLRSLTNNLRSAEDVRTEVDKATNEAKNSFTEQNASLSALKAELESLASVEIKISDYVSDYEDKVGAIQKYVEESEDELAELREAAETHYLSRYLAELEHMTESYTFELEDLASKEEDIEGRISNSKSKVMELLKKSQEVAKKLRKETSDSRDFDSSHDVVMSKVQRIKEIINDKESERAVFVGKSALFAGISGKVMDESVNERRSMPKDSGSPFKPKKARDQKKGKK